MTTASIETQRLILVPKTPEDAREWLAAVDAATRAQISPSWLELVASATAPDPWTLGLGIVLRATSTVIGQCGFKGPPADGRVEIAYGVDPDYQGRGYATEAATALVEYAFGRDDVSVVLAHTLEKDNASARVLRRCQFECLGTVVDSEDGLVWRWEVARNRYNSPPGARTH